MDTEYVEFLRRLLIKIENAINFLNHNPPRHILAYNKMLGVLQKLESVDDEYKQMMLLLARSSIQYFINGRYEDATKQIITLKKEAIKLYSYNLKKNERDNDKQVQAETS